LFTRVSINDKLEFRGGIDNLLDEDPVIVEARPGVDSNADITRPDYYDILGRRVHRSEDELLRQIIWSARRDARRVFSPSRNDV
jgi:hypothetical protein